MRWVWCLFIGLLFAACSKDEGGVASSTLETENTIAVNVMLADGNSASHSMVFVRPINYLPGSSELDEMLPANDSVLGIWNASTDENGVLRLPKFSSGAYMLEAVGASQKAAKQFEISSNSKDEIPVDVKLAQTTSLSGKINIEDFFPNGRPDGSVRVGIQGLTYFAEVDANGNFTIDSLPAGEFDIEAFVLVTKSACVGSECRNDAYVSTIGVQKIELQVEKKSQVEFKRTRPVSPKPVDPVEKVDSLETEIPEPVEDTLNYFLLDDFEEGIFAWYRSSSRYATATITSEEAGLGRSGFAAHFSYSNDSLYNWTLMGHLFNEPKDFSTLDSIRFWARGDDLLSLSLDKYIDSLDHGKTWLKVKLQNEWKQYVIVPSDFSEADSIGGNVGFEAVKNSITNINFFGGTGSEFWIDDVEIFGVKELE